MKRIAQIAAFLVLAISFQISKAQDKRSHEIGVIAGIAAFTTDYGQRYNFNANVGGNNGPGIGIIYYLNFTDYRYRWNQRTNYFSEHFRIRAELSYMSAKLDHFGKWAEQDTENGAKLRAHHGKTYLVNLGAQLEFHLMDIVDFGSRRIPKLWASPYISTGLFADFYNPSIWSDNGDWTDPGILYPKWDPNLYPNATNVDPGITGSATLGLGIRIKFGEYSDILVENRWQYFFSNYVDGLNAQPDPANKYNDWLVWLHVGYVYYLN